MIFPRTWHMKDFQSEWDFRFPKWSRLIFWNSELSEQAMNPNPSLPFHKKIQTFTQIISCGEELNKTEFSLHKIGARVLYNSWILVTTSLYLGAVCVELALLSWDHVHSYHSNTLLTADFLSGAGQFFSLSGISFLTLIGRFAWSLRRYSNLSGGGSCKSIW